MGQETSYRAQKQGRFWSRLVLSSSRAIRDALRLTGKGILWTFALIPYGFYRVVQLFTKNSDAASTSPIENKILVSLTEKERKKLEQLRLEGAQFGAKAIGLTKTGIEKKRTPEIVVESLKTRLGMTAASQMVAGTKNANHRELCTVIESLTQMEDTNDRIERVQNTINNTISNPYTNILSGEHAFSSGGDADLVTAIEYKLINNLVLHPLEFEHQGLQLSEHEKRQLQTYYENMSRSRDMSHILKAVCGNWGGYAPTDPKKGEPKDSYKKVKFEFEQKQKLFEDNLSLASRALQEAINELKEGESLYLETGLEGHAMQLIFKKEQGNIRISTYDSSGALENTALANGGIASIQQGHKSVWYTLKYSGLWAALEHLFNTTSGLFQLWQLGEESSRRNALSFSVSQEEVDSAKGLEYLSGLIRSNSMAGWAQTHIELKIKHTTLEERSHMGYFEKLFALNNQSTIYSTYLQHFSSLASTENPPQFRELLQRPQNTQNCFAKKSQSCELYELGKSTYKKVRLATLLEQKENLLNEVCGKKESTDISEKILFVDPEYISMLRTIEPEYLSPQELHEVSMRLVELKIPPNTLYFQNYFQSLLEVKTKLAQEFNEDNQLAIKKIDYKITSHARELYNYLKQNERIKDIQAIFIPEVVESSYNWESDQIPLKMDNKSSILTQALKILSAHANAQAWKAVIHLLNHQIKKLQVAQRYIHSEDERLEHVSYWSVSGKVTLHDLEEANVVSFNAGSSRKENIKIELNVEGVPKEIDKTTFFKLLLNHKTSLTHPKVIGLLDYLRNVSPEIEKQYIETLYKSQHQAFVRLLAQRIKSATTEQRALINTLQEHEKALSHNIANAEELIESLANQIKIEKNTLAPGLYSVKLQNLESEMDLLRNEVGSLERLKLSVFTKLQYLKAAPSVEGSTAHRIVHAHSIYEQLRAKRSPLKTINSISHAFRQAVSELESVILNLKEIQSQFEEKDMEEETQRRLKQKDLFRKKILMQHMETNAEYRILNQLAKGEFGTDRIRNKDMYQQSLEERIQFFKEGKNTFAEGSLNYEIQNLNQKLKSNTMDMLEKKNYVQTVKGSPLESMDEVHQEYRLINNTAEQLSQESIPEEIKAKWVKGMFALWLRYENPETIYKAQQHASYTTAINQAFHQFLEKKTQIKYADFQLAHYPIQLEQGDAEAFGMMPIDIEAYRKKVQEAATLIHSTWKAHHPKGTKRSSATQEVFTIQLNIEDLIYPIPDAQFKPFDPPDVTFLRLSEKSVSSENTLKFLHENPIPNLKGFSENEYGSFYKEAAQYLQKLETYSGLDNKKERIAQWCDRMSSTVFDAPFKPEKKLLTACIQSLLEGYREEGFLNKAFLNLENTERSVLLRNLIILNCADLKNTSVNPSFYSSMKHWEKLVQPLDTKLSAFIQTLEPNGTQPEDLTLIHEVDKALYQSPIGLEKIVEGQKGLQVALNAYGKEQGVDEDLRSLADKLGMRNGEALLPYQFLSFYSDPKIMLTQEGINSTQGRELFARAFLDALYHADTQERVALIEFITTIALDDQKNPCMLKVPHDVFLEELLLKSWALIPKALPQKPEIPKNNQLTSTLIKSVDGTDRLLGFARKSNHLALRISMEPENQKLYAEFICSHLAYQLILIQASSEIVSNLNANFEFVREMALLKANTTMLHEKLIKFTNQVPEQFQTIFNDYIAKHYFDGPIGTKLVDKIKSAENLPGFLSLGPTIQLDAIQGIVYFGKHQLGVLPASIQSHVTLDVLGIASLPFRSQGGAYIYAEQEGLDMRTKAVIIPQKDGNLIIQRALKTLNGTTQLLQYVPASHMVSLPDALKRRLKAEHYFIDPQGHYHAYTADFKPIVEFYKNSDNNYWQGQIVDHHNRVMPFTLNDKEHVPPFFPSGEMIRIDSHRMYLPALAQYLIETSFSSDLEQSHYYLSDNPDVEPDSLTKIIHKSDDDVLYTEEHGIKDYLIFVPKSSQISTLEEKLYHLEQAMNKAYEDYKIQGDSQAKAYLQAKKNYLLMKHQLDDAYTSAHYLCTYTEKGGILKPKDFQSILQIGMSEGKTDLLISLLGSHVPQAPLSSTELAQLQILKTQLKTSQENHLVQLMLIGTELQHHVLERKNCAIGKLITWDRKTYKSLLIEFSHEVKVLKEKHIKLPVNDFSELWRAIESEFNSKELHDFFNPPQTVVEPPEAQALHLKTRTGLTPIESLGARSSIQYTLSDRPEVVMDASQIDLKNRLSHLEGHQESIKAQEEGYYYENFGLFNAKTLMQWFSIKKQHAGVSGLNSKQVETLFEIMKQEGWLNTVDVGTLDHYQLSKHPSEFYSSSIIQGYLAKEGFKRKDMRMISDRLESFLYQSAQNGGMYSILPKDREAFIKTVSQAQIRYMQEYLDAQKNLNSIIAEATPPISFSELNAAYLLNDYRFILSRFPKEKSLKQIQIALNNGMTRYLYYKTETDHFNDVLRSFERNQDAQALSLMHIKRNYHLDRLFDSERALDPDASSETIEQERKMQRAFLLFEAEFGHRCNTRQVQVFRGLLLEDETDPDKIDSAQARMGFGKTTLLPLIALYKTGKRLVRFIVPKSALETNTQDMSLSLSNICAGRAIQDEFKRYKIESDPEPEMGEDSPRLKSLLQARDELKKRWILYKRVRDQREVLVQSPAVRNALECQSKIFLDMLLKLDPKEQLQNQALMQCITLLNEIRSMSSISVFDELDATQDPNSTEVNYTSGEKMALDPEEIVPLERITQTLKEQVSQSPKDLAVVLMNQFKIKDTNEQSILNYITSLNAPEPELTDATDRVSIFLMRGILTDPAMLSIFTEKEAGTDFGLWFQNAADGTKRYDYESLNTGAKQPHPLLISVPYTAANTPKPQGSRFDNPEVTAMTTFLYYLDLRTELQEVPHLEFLIQSLREGMSEKAFLDNSGLQVDPEFLTILHELKALAEIEDPIFRNAQREQYFKIVNKNSTLRRILARAVIQEQVQMDAGKAQSNRYEQGQVQDRVLGFSGTAGDTSSYFQEHRLDSAADGTMTIGIMGREDCQRVHSLNNLSDSEEYNSILITQLVQSFNTNTRALIDIGGLCKSTNRGIARELALQLKELSKTGNNATPLDPADKARDVGLGQNQLNEEPTPLKEISTSRGLSAGARGLKPLKGVIFYDDVTNTQKILRLDEHNQNIIDDFTSEMMEESDQHGNYFTYYDQSHSRGSNIKQQNGAHAVATLNFTTSNNDYKQGIMRMRKIIDKTSGQSFSLALPQTLEQQIRNDIKRSEPLAGNDIALWLRQKELQLNTKIPVLLMQELNSIAQNAILQKQAQLTELMQRSPITNEQIQIFKNCVEQLNSIIPFISNSFNDLKAKYGEVYGEINKQEFLTRLSLSLENQLASVYSIVNQAREDLGHPLLLAEDFKPYHRMKENIIRKREIQLSERFIIPYTEGNVLSESHSEVEHQTQSQSQSQSQSQAQTHSFSEISSEEVIVNTILMKYPVPLEAVNLDYLSTPEELVKAHDVDSLHHLFHDQDPIVCSPLYKDPLPPIRYFLVRDSGHPQVILINQDEAGVFKKSSLSFEPKGWSLYDIRGDYGILNPLVGSKKVLPQSLSKQLKFAAYREDIKGDTLDQLAQSMKGILTVDQLRPSLEISITDTKNLAENATLFHLSNWGFSGTRSETFHIYITPIKELKFVDKLGNKHEKNGMTILLKEGGARADVFISFKLSKHFTAKEYSKIQDLAEQIKTNHKVAMEQRTELNKKSKALRAEKKKIFIDYAQQIKELETQRKELITKNTELLLDRFPEAMHAYLNLIKWDDDTPVSDTSLNYVKGISRSRRDDAPRKGIKYDGEWHSGLDDAVENCVSEFYKKNQDQLLLDNELETLLDETIVDLFEVVDSALSTYKTYLIQNSVLIEALYTATIKKNEVILWRSNATWGTYIENALEYLFHDISRETYDNAQDTVEDRERTFNNFVEAIKEIILNAREQNTSLTIETLEEKILNIAKDFAVENDYSSPEKFVDMIRCRLCYSTIPLDNEQNRGLNQKYIKELIIRTFLEVVEEPSDERTTFYNRLENMLNLRTLKNDYILPSTLSDFETNSSEDELIRAVEQTFSNQNIATTKSEINKWTNKVSERLLGQKALMDLLKHYQPIPNRPIEFGPLDGQQRRLFVTSHKILTGMDTQVLSIDDKIAQLKAQRKSAIQNIEKDYKVVKEELAANTSMMKQLRGELSSLNKLIDGIKKFMGMFFKEHHIYISESKDETVFFDNYLDLPSIIQDEVSATATLTFIPPVFHELKKDMEAQYEHMHGLFEPIEFQARDALNAAEALVNKDAAQVQFRQTKLNKLTKDQSIGKPEETQLKKKTAQPKFSELSSNPIPFFQSKATDSDIKAKEKNIGIKPK